VRVVRIGEDGACGQAGIEGKLWVLDFKPNATKEDPAKVATQLTMYARGLAYRAEVPLGEMRCAWFDEADCFSFRPEWG
jgi:hypothetical protein